MLDEAARGMELAPPRAFCVWRAAPWARHRSTLVLVALAVAAISVPQTVKSAGQEGSAATSPSASSSRTAIRFSEASADWGLDFRHTSGAAGRYFMVETNGGGVVVFDYDDDGDDDLFLASGGPLPGSTGPPGKGSRLYRNDRVGHGGRFVDVTERSGLTTDPAQFYASGGAAGDVDGDGDLDLYVTAFGANRLWLNRGDGTFELTVSGAETPGWSASAALADVDRDGDLDLYVTQYVDFTLDHNLACGDSSRGLRGYCGPDVYRPLPDPFYRNDGTGPGGRGVRFVEAGEAAGLTASPGAGLASMFGDLDGDGWSDLYVANDLTPNFLFHNRGDGRFEDRSLLSGTAYGPRGKAEAGMGVALGDFDGDGRNDVVVTNYEGESNGLYSQNGPLLFADRRFVAGLARDTLRSLAFGVAAADFDLDGDLDLVFANGHVRENATEFNRASRYRQPNQVFENLGGGRFREVDAGIERLAASRGLAVADFDLDGDLDWLASNVDEPAELYRNEILDLADSAARPWLAVLVRRDGGQNRFGVGTRVAVTFPGLDPSPSAAAGGASSEREQWREVTAGGSYMSQHGHAVHFGLGVESRADSALSVTVGPRPGAGHHLLGVPTSRRLVWILPPLL